MNKKISCDPKVTIVIPVYNGEKYVKYAIDSALAQTYKNLEILVINDGSVDRTDEIVKSYGRKIRYIKKENGGVSSALNLAIKEMRGEYFSWLSHDDTYEPNKIEREIEFLKENNYLGKKVIVFSDYYLIDKKGKLITESKKDHEEIAKKPEYSLLKGHINGLTLLIPKEAFDECGEFNADLSCAQDYEMWWKMMNKGYKFVHIQETLVSTRWHKEQTTQTSPKVITEGNAFYSKVLNSISEKRMNELEGSKYFFLKEMSDFYKNSVYVEFSKQCEKKAQGIFDSVKDRIAAKKVSVIIPFFNRDVETQKAIRSVLNQTHKNWEIILVNDGSTEDISGVRELVKENQEKIIFIDNEKNSGVSVARNEGIKMATGDYIAFLDSDDEFVKDKLETQLQYMIAAKAVISHTSYSQCSKKKGSQYVNSGKMRGYCVKEMICNCMIATPTVMLDLGWLRNKKILFNVDFKVGEDTCFWLDLLKYNKTYLVGINEALTIVHVGDSSAVSSVEKQVMGLKNIMKYLLNDNYYNVFDNEIACLAMAYTKHVKKVQVLKTPEPFAGNNAIQKLCFFVKQEGFVSTGRRIIKKINKIISSRSEN
jgi:glycosyltransferase involved in cell wall biosynthesis